MAVSGLSTVFPTWQQAVSAITKLLNQVINGEMNTVGMVTLTANAASTVVTDQRAGPGRAIALCQPTTANAAAALATSYIDPEEVGAGTFKIRHANNAQTDRTFRYEIKG
jgi:sugar (pentulose or hexulose) kinase